LRRLSRGLARHRQKRRRQIAAVALPRPAAPSPALALAAGGDPQRAGFTSLGATTGLGVGRVGLIQQQDGRRARRHPALKPEAAMRLSGSIQIRATITTGKAKAAQAQPTTLVSIDA